MLFLFIDDLIINKIISNKFFNKILKLGKNNKLNHLRLHISTKPKYYDGFVGKLPKKSPYKISTMPSIWKRNFLLKYFEKW